MTYQKYLTDYRVDRAKKLLAETELHIYEVCKAVGYSDVNHFNQTFERVEGMKPRRVQTKIQTGRELTADEEAFMNSKIKQPVAWRDGKIIFSPFSATR